jgi:hypothetical protein
MARVLDAFGRDADRGGPDFARFYLLRSGPLSQAAAAEESLEGRRLDEALARFGRGPFQHRGHGYLLYRPGGSGGPSNRESYETLRNTDLVALLQELREDAGVDAEKRAAAGELLTSVEARRATGGTAGLLLLRRQRSYLRQSDESGPSITPSNCGSRSSSTGSRSPQS